MLLCCSSVILLERTRQVQVDEVRALRDRGDDSVDLRAVDGFQLRVIRCVVQAVLSPEARSSLQRSRQMVESFGHAALHFFVSGIFQLANRDMHREPLSMVLVVHAPDGIRCDQLLTLRLVRTCESFQRFLVDGVLRVQFALALESVHKPALLVMDDEVRLLLHAAVGRDDRVQRAAHLEDRKC